MTQEQIDATKLLERIAEILADQANEWWDELPKAKQRKYRTRATRLIREVRDHLEAGPDDG